MSKMERSDAARAVWRCSVQGFVTIRSTARYGIEETEATAVGLAPGFAEAKLFIAEVASVGLAIRLALRAGSNNVEALIGGWMTAGEAGRCWLADTVREYAGHRAYSSLPAVVGTHTAPSAVMPDYAVRQGCSRRAGWCRAMLTAGYSDIRELALNDASDWNAAETRRRIEVIADACHRIPYPEELPAALRPWLVRRYLNDGWGSMTADGQRWCREGSAGLSRPTPRAINRILSSSRQ